MKLTEEYYRKVLDNLYDGIYFIDQNKRIIYWNSGAEKLTGHTQSDVIGKHCGEVLVHANDKGIKLCDTLCPISQTVASGCVTEVEVYFHHKEGHLVPASMRIAPIKDLDDQIVVAVELFNEKSPKYTLRQKVEELKKLALVDPLTELGNRSYAEMNLRGRLEEMDRYGWSFGVLFIDIDHFKDINDQYGHNIGDRVLKMVSTTMSNTLRPFDIISRWGGEEFVAVIVNVNEQQLHAVSNRLRMLVEQSSISSHSENIRVTVSVGGTLVKKDDTVDSLIKRADQSMYKSKVSGRNCIFIDMNDISLQELPQEH